MLISGKNQYGVGAAHELSGHSDHHRVRNFLVKQRCPIHIFQDLMMRIGCIGIDCPVAILYSYGLIVAEFLLEDKPENLYGREC